MQCLALHEMQFSRSCSTSSQDITSSNVKSEWKLRALCRVLREDSGFQGWRHPSMDVGRR